MSTKTKEEVAAAEGAVVTADPRLTNRALTGVSYAMMDMYAEDTDAGFEETSKDDYAIPFLKVLQSMSPVCKKSDGAYIKGAEEGMLFNTVTEEFIDGAVGVTIVPCFYRRNFLEFTGTQEEGGNFNGEHSAARGEELLERCKVDSDGDMRLYNEDGTCDGHILTEVRNHFCLVVNEDGTVIPVVLSLTSTQIKKSKKWMTLMQGMKLPNDATAPMFSQMYKLTTVAETKDKFSWYGVKLDHIGPVTSKKVYSAAKEFRDLVKGDQAKVDFDKM